MNEELDKELCARYPKIFVNRNASAQRSAMHWGIACGDGWYNILNQLCSCIQWHIEQTNERNERAHEEAKLREALKAGDYTLFDQYVQRTGLTDPKWIEARRQDLLGETPPWKLPCDPVPQVIAAQVKEKYGTLRFYYDGGDEAIRGMVTMAESMSSVTCEDCGKPGSLRPGSWVRTLCDEHASTQEVKSE